MEEFCEAEAFVVKERGEKWAGWRELCVRAERLKEQGETEMTVSIELLLLARDIPRSIERFYSQLFKRASEYKSNKAP